jgi:Skp family chaperone for outer membrane proteins
MTFAQLFVTPLGKIGESLSEFFAGTMLHVPIFLWPVIIILILFIFVIVILMYSKYEIHLPFMMGSLRPSPHAAITRTTNIVEQIDNSSNQSPNYLQELENKVQKLQIELQQKNLELEHNTTRPSRASSIERTNQQRERSPSNQQRQRSPSNQQRERSASNQRSNTDAQVENELRQRTTSPNIGFREDFLPK